MLSLKINYANGDYGYSRINATLEEAREYYEGQLFNLGPVLDNMQQCTSIEILKEE
jgi:hypothetical protein